MTRPCPERRQGAGFSRLRREVREHALLFFGVKIPRNLPFQSGTRIGHYEIHTALGAGGMGEVYRARDMRLGRDVALKVLPDSVAADPDRIARFEREAQILAALSHANIAAIHGLEISGPTRVLVMELVSGESLETRLRRGALPLDDALAIALQVGDALSAAHERGIVHRDLKPGNVMLTGDGAVKVLDFGLARMVEADAAVSGLSMSPTISIQATMAGTILGTAPYMSPEQARGRSVDKRTDVWAFGCVLYEMLTGKRAFGGDDLTETIATIVKGEADWKALESVVPPHVVSAVRGCLVKDPKQRFADIAVALFVLTTSPTAAPPVAPAVAPAPASRWKRAMVPAASAVAAVLLTGGAAWMMRPATTAPEVIRFTIPLPAGQTLTTTGRRSLTFSPDGRKLAYVASSRIFIRSMSDAEPHPVPGSDVFRGALNALSFSPDGQELAFYTAEGTAIRRIAAAGGSAVVVSPVLTNPIGMVWEPAGILFAIPAKGIYQVSRDGGEPKLLVAIEAGELAGTPESLPGNRGILYSIRKTGDSWDQANITVQLPNGERRVLVRNASDGRYDGYGHLLYATSGVVMAAPFNVGTLTVTGGAIPAIEGVVRDLYGNNSGIAQYAVAPNGTLAYVPGPVKAISILGDRTLAVFDDQGGFERLDVRPGLYASPRVSPDGKAVAFEASTGEDANIAVKDLNSAAAVRRLTFGGHNQAPVWSPDSQWIAFRSDRDGDLAVYRQRADGSGAAERLTAKQPMMNYAPMSWSPDGTSLLLNAERNGAHELHVLSLKDRTLSRFSDVRSAVATQASFSPDGRWIVYQRNDTTNPSMMESFVEPFPATGAKYQVPVKAGHPFWSRRGDRLFLNSASTASTVIDVRTTPTLAFTAPRDFPRARRSEPNPAIAPRWADAMPDGRIIGITTDLGDLANGTLPRQFEVILNWQQALDAKLAR